MPGSRLLPPRAPFLLHPSAFLLPARSAARLRAWQPL